MQTLPAAYDRDGLLAARAATYVIHQEVSYSYSTPIRDLHQRLVVLPKLRHLDQRRVAQWVEVDGVDAAEIRRSCDRFGNSVVQVSVPKVANRIVFHMRAVVDRSPATDPTPGGGAIAWRCATTDLTQPDEAIGDAANQLRGDDVTETVLAISRHVRASFEYCHDVTTVRTSAAQAWALKRGVCQDMAHVMVAMCACLGIPARYVSGHMVGDGASHAWVEAYDAGRDAVISIDPTHDRPTDLRYITTATGRDYRDVAPTSGTYASSGSRGRLQVRKVIRIADLA